MEMNKEAIQAEIGRLEQDIETKKQELADVQAKLGGPTDEGNPPVSPETPASNSENGGNASETDMLKAKEQELIQAITADQMKLVALRKQLDDMNGDEMVNNMNRED